MAAKIIKDKIKERINLNFTLLIIEKSSSKPAYNQSANGDIQSVVYLPHLGQ